MLCYHTCDEHTYENCLLVYINNLPSAQNVFYPLLVKIELDTGPYEALVVTSKNRIRINQNVFFPIENLC